MFDADLSTSFRELDPGAVQKVGPHGYIHGWIFVGIPGVGDPVSHPGSGHGHGVITGRDEKAHTISVKFANGHTHTFGYDPDPKGAHHLVRTDHPVDDLDHKHEPEPVQTRTPEERYEAQRDMSAHLDLLRRAATRQARTDNPMDNPNVVHEAARQARDDAFMEMAGRMRDANNSPHSALSREEREAQTVEAFDAAFKRRMDMMHRSYPANPIRVNRPLVDGGKDHETVSEASTRADTDALALANQYRAAHAGDPDVLHANSMARHAVLVAVKATTGWAGDSGAESSLTPAQRREVTEREFARGFQRALEGEHIKRREQDRLMGPVTDTVGDGAIQMRLQAVHPELRKEIVDRAQKFYDEFPVAAQGLVIRPATAKERHQSYAVTYHIPKQIILNGAMYKGTKAQQKITNATHADFVTGFHPTEGSSGIIDHELGHVLDNYAGITKSGSYQTSASWSKVAPQISRYARKNAAESFAEAFEWRQQKGIDALPPEVKELMQQALQKAGGKVDKALEPDDEPSCDGYIGPAAQRYLDSLPPDEDDERGESVREQLGKITDLGKHFDQYELRGPNGRWIHGSGHDEQKPRTQSEYVQEAAQTKAQKWYDSKADHDYDIVPHTARGFWADYQNPAAYGGLNSILRDPDQPGSVRPKLMKAVDKMFDEAGTTTDKDMTVWRALRSSDSGIDWPSRLKKGSTFTDSGMISTTANGDLAEGWLDQDASGEHHDDASSVFNDVDSFDGPDAPPPKMAPGHEKDVVMEIHIPKGTRIVGGTDQFIETMLHPDSQFKITDSYLTTSHPGDPLNMGDPLPPFQYTRVVATMTKDGAAHGS